MLNNINTYSPAFKAKWIGLSKEPIDNGTKGDIVSLKLMLTNLSPLIKHGRDGHDVTSYQAQKLKDGIHIKYIDKFLNRNFFPNSKVEDSTEFVVKCKNGEPEELKAIYNDKHLLSKPEIHIVSIDENSTDRVKKLANLVNDTVIELFKKKQLERQFSAPVDGNRLN